MPRPRKKKKASKSRRRITTPIFDPISGRYNLQRTDGNGDYVWQNDYLTFIRANGFSTKPSYLYPTGMGLQRCDPGTILRTLYQVFGEERFQLVFEKENPSELGDRRVTFNIRDFARVAEPLVERKKEQTQERAEYCQALLANIFPGIERPDISYTRGQLHKLLQDPANIKRLSEADIDAILKNIPLLQERIKHRPGSLQLAKRGKKSSEIFFLDAVIKEYEKRLNSKAQQEEKWQRFFYDHLLKLEPRYQAILDRQNISLEEKLPDFLMIDEFNHLDVLEIKKPVTKLLQLESSRKNYYWSTELSKAIAQVESYIDSINLHRAQIEKLITKQTGVVIDAVRPRVECGRVIGVNAA